MWNVAPCRALAVSFLLSGSFVTSADAATILLSQQVAGGSISVQARLTGLGHTLVVSDATTWGPAFDYSIYDVVAFEFNCSNPADIQHLVNAVDAGQVGVIFFRGYNAESTAMALGMITAPQLWWQSPTDLDIIDNSHYITAGLPLGVQNLGYTYMSEVQAPNLAMTTILGRGPANPALLVHDTRRVVIVPFYGHDVMASSETPTGILITERAIEWVSQPTVPPPTCMLTGPAAPASGEVTIDVSSASSSAPSVDLLFEFSTDAGASWSACTAAAGSLLPNPAIGTPTGNATFVWDSVADAVGVAIPQTGIVVRAQVDDGVAPAPAVCSTAPFDVDNSALCSTLCGDCDEDLIGPTILDALTAAQVSAGLATPSPLQMGCCDVNASGTVTILDALGIAQVAAGLVATLTCP